MMPPATRETGELHCSGASRVVEIPARPTATNSSRMATLIPTTIRSVRATVDAPAMFRTVMSRTTPVRNTRFHTPRESGGRELDA